MNQWLRLSISLPIIAGLAVAGYLASEALLGRRHGDDYAVPLVYGVPALAIVMLVLVNRRR